jgi:hypothetical protein
LHTTLNLSYQVRKDKKYKSPLTNAKQTPEQRREKYKKLRGLGATVTQARQLRDWFLNENVENCIVCVNSISALSNTK